MIGRTSLTASLLFAACVAACGRPLMVPRDGAIDVGGPGGGAVGGSGSSAGGDGRGGAGAGAGETGAGGSGGGVAGTGGTSGIGGTSGRCRCSDGRCCGPDQLCEIPTAACLKDGLPDGSCISPPSACDENYQPVCGCDEITYSNDCYRQRARVPKRTDGVCVGACPPLQPVGACTNPGKVCTYGLNSNPGCTVKVMCDATGQWAASPVVCP